MSAKKNRSNFKTVDIGVLLKKFDRIVYPCHALDDFFKNRKDESEKLGKLIWNEFGDSIMDVLVREKWLENMVDWDKNDLKSIQKIKSGGKTPPQLAVILRQIAKQTDYFSYQTIMESFYQHLMNGACEVWQMAVILNIASIYLEKFDEGGRIRADIEKLSKENAEDFKKKYQDVIKPAVAALAFQEYISLREIFMERFEEARSAIIREKEMNSFQSVEEIFVDPMREWVFTRKALIQKTIWLAKNYGEETDASIHKKGGIFLFSDLLTDEICRQKSSEYVQEALSLMPSYWIDDLELMLQNLEPAFSEHDMKVAVAEIRDLRDGKLRENQSFLKLVIFPAIRGQSHPDVDDIDGECLYSMSLFSKIGKGKYELKYDPEPVFVSIQSSAFKKEYEAHELIQAVDDEDSDTGIVPVLVEEQDMPADRKMIESGSEMTEELPSLPDRGKIVENLNSEMSRNTVAYSTDYHLTGNDLALLGNMGSLARVFDRYTDAKAPKEKRKEKNRFSLNKKRDFIEGMSESRKVDGARAQRGQA